MGLSKGKLSLCPVGKLPCIRADGQNLAGLWGSKELLYADWVIASEMHSIKRKAEKVYLIGPVLLLLYTLIRIRNRRGHFGSRVSHGAMVLLMQPTSSERPLLFFYTVHVLELAGLAKPGISIGKYCGLDDDLLSCYTYGRDHRIHDWFL
jgi:hypothetical protein